MANQGPKTGEAGHFQRLGDSEGDAYTIADMISYPWIVGWEGQSLPHMANRRGCATVHANLGLPGLRARSGPAQGRFDRWESRVNRTLPHRLAYLALLLGLLPALACARASGSQPSGMPEGINDAFLSENLDVDWYVERFEGESRGVYAQRHAIVESLELSPGDRIADIGAGTGFFSFLFAAEVTSKTGNDGAVYAVEIAPKFLERLRERAENPELGVLHVVEGTERSVELADDSIDVAFLCDVYHHFAYPDDSLASLHSAIRPGGSLVLIEFERIPGKTPDWLLEHVRAGREVFSREIESAGFVLAEEIEMGGLEGNYILRFERMD